MFLLNRQYTYINKARCIGDAGVHLLDAANNNSNNINENKTWFTRNYYNDYPMR